MIYLLDANVCIALLNEISTPVRAKYDETLLEGDALAVSSIVIFELFYGVAKSRLPYANSTRLKMFLSEQVEILDFNAEDAEAAGKVRAELERKKQTIGPMDTLIAGQALARGLMLVTANVTEFTRVDGLNWTDWSR